MTQALLIPVLPPGHNLVEVDVHALDGAVTTLSFTHEGSPRPFCPVIELDDVAEIHVIDHGHQAAMFSQTTVTEAFVIMFDDAPIGPRWGHEIRVDSPWKRSS